MHEDICNLAEDKRAALIIIPFHRQQTVDGGMEDTNPAYRMVNQNVLANSPCSVGILVDRGLNGLTKLSASQVSHHHVGVFFFGGPDDREALAYGWRMSDHPGIKLTVVRFVARGDTLEGADGTIDLRMTIDTDRNKQLDEEYLNEFRMRNANNESVSYMEVVANNGEETVAAIRSIDSSHDLFIVGRGHGMISPLTAGLTDWSECPELGAIGDLLASSDFTASVSVLVIQQYVGGLHGDGVGTTESPRISIDQFSQHVNRRPPQSRNYGP
ncbi:hypothetical protein MLD38_031480 [Melastoma candidum]|nr:hypothetical protein MLD38_031480 [Melastoma candidum]